MRSECEIEPPPRAAAWRVTAADDPLHAAACDGLRAASHDGRTRAAEQALCCPGRCSHLPCLPAVRAATAAAHMPADAQPADLLLSTLLT